MAGRLRNEDGFTLMELMVAAAVGVVVMLAAMALLDMSVSTQTSATDRVETVQQGRETMQRIARILRSHTCLEDGKPGLVEATATSVRVHSAIGPERLTPGFQKIDDRRIVFDATNRRLSVQTYAGIESGPNPTPSTLTFSPTPTTDVIGQGIRADGATSVFRYYTFTGNPATATLELVPGGGGLSEADRLRVARVEVRYVVRVRDNAASTRFSTFTNSFWIRTADPENTAAGGGCT